MKLVSFSKVLTQSVVCPRRQDWGCDEVESDVILRGSGGAEEGRRWVWEGRVRRTMKAPTFWR